MRYWNIEARPLRKKWLRTSPILVKDIAVNWRMPSQIHPLQLWQNYAKAVALT